MLNVIHTNPQLHVRFEGHSWDLPLADLDVGFQSTDDQIRTAIAACLDVPMTRLAIYVIERHANGNLTLRPEAVFG